MMMMIMSILENTCLYFLKSLTIDNVIRLSQTIDLVGNVKCLGIGPQSERVNHNVHNKLINFYKENL